MSTFKVGDRVMTKDGQRGSVIDGPLPFSRGFSVALDHGSDPPRARLRNYDEEAIVPLHLVEPPPPRDLAAEDRAAREADPIRQRLEAFYREQHVEPVRERAETHLDALAKEILNDGSENAAAFRRWLDVATPIVAKREDTRLVGKRRVRVRDVMGARGVQNGTVLGGNRHGELLLLLDWPRPEGRRWGRVTDDARTLGATDDMLPRLTWALASEVEDIAERPFTGKPKRCVGTFNGTPIYEMDAADVIGDVMMISAATPADPLADARARFPVGTEVECEAFGWFRVEGYRIRDDNGKAQVEGPSISDSGYVTHDVDMLRDGRASPALEWREGARVRHKTHQITGVVVGYSHEWRWYLVHNSAGLDHYATDESIARGNWEVIS